MKIVKIEKNSDAWLEDRKGKITGSKSGDIASRSSFTKDAIFQELKALGIEFDAKAKKEDLEPLLPMESKIRLMLANDKKIGFYQLIADKLATIDETDETPMERGHRCEAEAIATFGELAGFEQIDTEQFWISDVHKDIAVSPDGVIDDENAIEVKCLSSAKHLQAFFEKKIPSEYEFQVLQYFIVNENLQKLYFVFYDPRVTSKPIHWIEVNRDELADDIETYIAYQIETLKQVEQLVEQLAF